MTARLTIQVTCLSRITCSHALPRQTQIVIINMSQQLPTARLLKMVVHGTGPGGDKDKPKQARVQALAAVPSHVAAPVPLSKSLSILTNATRPGRGSC